MQSVALDIGMDHDLTQMAMHMRHAIDSLSLDIAFALAVLVLVLVLVLVALNWHDVAASVENGSENAAAAAVVICTFHSDYPWLVFDNASMSVVLRDSDYSMAVAFAADKHALRHFDDFELGYN